MHYLLSSVTTFSLSVSLCHILLAVVALGILFFLFMVICAARVKVDRRDIYPLDSARKESVTVTVGFFSDTHGFGCLKSPKWIAEHFLQENCDIVLFGGDCVHKKNVHHVDKKMLTEVSFLLKQKNIDLIAVHGNHDWQLEKKDYDQMGVILLSDGWREIPLSGAKMAVCGISDSERGQRPWGTIPKEFSEFDGFRLVLVHNPDFIYSLPDMSQEKNFSSPMDYVLSGHLHGGQVHLPGNIEFIFFRKDRIAGEEGILGGEYSFRGYKGFISKGAGNGFLPIRFMARPEIHILRFHI